MDLTGFLLECDKNGKILNIYWNEPTYIVSPYQKRLTDLFSEDVKQDLEAMIVKSKDVSEMLYCSKNLELRSPKRQISVCFLASEKSILVHGIDVMELGIESAMPALKKMIYNFMKVLHMFDGKVITDNERIMRFQFEQIQKLNNDLLNTQRQLQKANAQLKRANEVLNNRLVKDALTGLVSRYQYREEIDMLIKTSPEKKGIFTFIDIDDFKRINDNYGHNVGDIYLKIFAKRLSKLNFENAIFMRISGDEFGVYIHGYDEVNDDDIKKVWEEIEDKIVSSQFEIQDNKHFIYCSAGMAVYAEDTNSVYELIDYADFAMYIAKKSGKNSYRRFNLEQYKSAKN